MFFLHPLFACSRFIRSIVVVTGGRRILLASSRFAIQTHEITITTGRQSKDYHWVERRSKGEPWRWFASVSDRRTSCRCCCRYFLPTNYLFSWFVSSVCLLCDLILTHLFPLHQTTNKPLSSPCSGHRRGAIKTKESTRGSPSTYRHQTQACRWQKPS